MGFNLAFYGNRWQPLLKSAIGIAVANSQPSFSGGTRRFRHAARNASSRAAFYFPLQIFPLGSLSRPVR